MHAPASTARPIPMTSAIVSCRDPGAAVADFDGPYLEGYAWGGLTSGSAWRSLWLLLLPFSLLNVAPRMRPADPPTDSKGAGPRPLPALAARTLARAVLDRGLRDGVHRRRHGPDRLPMRACWTPALPVLRGSTASCSAILRRTNSSSVRCRAAASSWRCCGSSAGGRSRAYEAVGVLDTLAEPRASGPEPPGLKSRWMWQNECPVRRLRAVASADRCRHGRRVRRRCPGRMAARTRPRRRYRCGDIRGCRRRDRELHGTIRVAPAG